MKIIIVEDEKPAAEKLSMDLLATRADVEIVEILHNVQAAIRWFHANNQFDLVFMDVELSDGLSFEILKQVEISAPIIFITAYDHYWQKALALNGINYLLKPVERSDLEKSLDKYDKIKRHFSTKLDSFMSFIAGNSNSEYKSKFLVRRGKELVMVSCSDIVFFKSSHKVTMMITKDGRKLIVEESLVQLEHQLDPEYFARANRQFIVNIKFVKRIIMYPKGRLKIEMMGSDEEIIIAQDKVAHFKRWLEGDLK